MFAEGRIKVIDNFLEKEEADLLEKEFLHPKFPWYYADRMSEDDHLQERPDHQFQFCHNFYFDYKPTSSFFPILKSLIEKMKIKSIVRIKSNCIPMTLETIKHAFHIDYDNNITAIYYVNTNNGYTEFETGDKVHSLKNRIVIFDSNLKHRGTTCTDKHNRININLNYYGS